MIRSKVFLFYDKLSRTAWLQPNSDLLSKDPGGQQNLRKHRVTFRVGRGQAGTLKASKGFGGVRQYTREGRGTPLS